MITPVPALAPELDFDTAMTQLRASGLSALPVVGVSGNPVGLLSLENISELIQVQRAIGKA